MRWPLASASPLLLLALVAAAPGQAAEPDFAFLEPGGLRTVSAGEPVLLRWDGSDPLGSLQVGLYASRQAVSNTRPPQVEQDVRIHPEDVSLAEGPFQLEWDTTGLAPGCYQPYALLQGEQAQHLVAAGKVVVRGPGPVPPAVWLENAREEQVDAYGRYVLRFRVSDPDSPTTVSLKLGNGTELLDVVDGLTFPAGGGEGRWELDVSGLAAGAWELYARVESPGEPACEAFWPDRIWVPGGPYLQQRALVCEADLPDAGPPAPAPPAGGGGVLPPPPSSVHVEARSGGCAAAPGGLLVPLLPLLWRRRSSRAPRRTRTGPLPLLGLLLLAPAARAQPAKVGEWTAVQEWPDTGTHLTLLPGGKVVSWAEYKPTPVFLWEPGKGVATTITEPDFNVFCAGHTLLADGRLFVAGGHLDSNKGLPHAAIYDPATDAWTRLPDMNAGRWYPTTTLLPNGDVLVIAGTDTARRVGENRLPQVWETANNRWRDLTDARVTLRTYPWMFVAPNGKLFMAGPDPVARYLDTTGKGAWTDVAPSNFGDRFAGSAVMYEDGKVLVTGGGEARPTDTAEVIDLNAPAPAWRSLQSMRQKRKQHNMTLLPDGTVLVTGGSSGPGKSDPDSPVLATELWDPVTEQFSLLAPSRVFRGYHSTALLLPDGRVLSAGGEKTLNMQLFSPPYLFKGPRPTVTSAPRAIGFGQPFRVRTPDAARIRKVTLLRTGAVTHAFNQSQRLHTLPFTREADGLTVTAPANAVAAQPGHFMLFLLDEQGVPSVAHFVRLQEGPVPEEEVQEQEEREEACWTGAPSCRSPQEGRPPALDRSGGSTIPGVGVKGCGAAPATPSALALLLALGWGLGQRAGRRARGGGGWTAALLLVLCLTACEERRPRGRQAPAPQRRALVDPAYDAQLRALSPPSLKTVPVPRPAQLATLVQDEAAAVALGKAFFWDMQAGSDGRMACATCHFHAGADARLQGTRHPGPDGSFQGGGVRATLTLADFPFHKRVSPGMPDSEVLADCDDVVGSQGILKGRLAGLPEGTSQEQGEELESAFKDCQGSARQVTARNAPSVINSVFYFRHFWDGRASHYFNGVNAFGAGDVRARVWVDDGEGLRRERLLLENAALASQAVAPVLNTAEMSWEGRTLPLLGRKLLAAVPLSGQQVHAEDSVLGPLRHASGRGLALSYGELIARAFQPRYHASAQKTPEGLTQLEANFALFWGVALQLYQSTLVSDDAPFDRFMEGDGAALTDTQKEGLLIFVTHGRCNRCHTGAEFTSATVGALVGEQKVVTAMALAQGTGLYDFGFYNLGVRPPREDVGLGGSNPFGQPLSYARQLVQGTGELDVCARGGVGCPGPEHLSDGGTPLTGSERLGVTGAFKTPGLRNVELTGPYMHNGGMATLLEVMEFYHRGGDFPEENRDFLGPHMGSINLESGHERQVLADFLTSLTDERVRHQRAPFDHPELTLPDGQRVEAVGRQGGAPLLPFHQRLP